MMDSPSKIFPKLASLGSAIRELMDDPINLSDDPKKWTICGSRNMPQNDRWVSCVSQTLRGIDICSMVN